MNFPDDLRYHREHTWVKIKGDKALIGITDYAQDTLGDIVYIDLPEVDSVIEANSEFSEIESTKATSSVIAPVGGTIVEVNETLEESPEVINEDPYGKGWIVALEISDNSDLDSLLDSSEYEKLVEEESK
ncbi:MAG: glycine cleavage system protein GcvH [Thermodesulfovibrionales bacterium]